MTEDNIIIISKYIGIISKKAHGRGQNNNIQEITLVPFLREPMADDKIIIISKLH